MNARQGAYGPEYVMTRRSPSREGRRGASGGTYDSDLAYAIWRHEEYVVKRRSSSRESRAARGYVAYQEARERFAQGTAALGEMLALVTPEVAVLISAVEAAEARRVREAAEHEASLAREAAEHEAARRRERRQRRACAASILALPLVMFGLLALAFALIGGM